LEFGLASGVEIIHGFTLHRDAAFVSWQVWGCPSPLHGGPLELFRQDGFATLLRRIGD
jgi:hypothetical protein